MTHGRAASPRRRPGRHGACFALAVFFAGMTSAGFAAATPDGTPAAQEGRPASVAETLRQARETLRHRLANLGAAEERADAWGDLAMLYHAQDMLDEAERAYRESLREASSARWRYLLAVTLTDRGDTAAAIAEYRRVLADAEGRHALASYRLGLLLLLEGDHRAARSALQDARRHMPESAAVLAALGDAAVAAGDWKAALPLLQRAAELAPTAGRIAYKLALAHRQLGDLEQARLWLSRRNASAAPVDDPLLLEVAERSLSPKFYIKAGERAWRRGEREDALAAWRNAAQLAPDDADAGLVYAHALGELGRRRAAAGEARRVLAKHPNSARGWYVLALQLRHGASVDEAIAAAERAVRLMASASETGPAERPFPGGDQDEATVRTLLAALWMRAKRFGQAAREYRTLAQSNPETAYYRYWLGVSSLGAGDCAGGRNALAEALRLQGNWGQAHIALARADALCGSDALRQGARQRAKRLLAVQDSVDTRLTLAFAELGLGRLDQARRLAAAEQPHADAALILDALSANSLPTTPFASTSSWWLPEEAQPEVPSVE